MSQTKAQLIDGKGSVDLGALSISGSAPDNSVNLDSSGRLLIGTSTARGVSSATTPLNLIETTNTTLGIAVVRNANDGAGGILALGKSKGTTVGSVNLVNSGDILGDIRFAGADGVDLETIAASIRGEVDDTPGAKDMPGRLVFSTSRDGQASPTEACRIDSSQRLLINTAAVNNPQGGAAQLALEKTSGSIHAAAYSASLANTQSVQFRADSGNRAAVIGVIKHSGITNNCGFLQVSAEDAASAYLWADNSDQLRISANSAHIGTTSGTVVGTQTSDERIKNILGPVTYGLDEIKQLNPVSYALKSDPEQVPHLGFIAQQVLPLVPESVFDTDEEIEEGEPTKLGMEYVALIPVLVNAIKELSAEVDALKAQLQAS